PRRADRARGGGQRSPRDRAGHGRGPHLPAASGGPGPAGADGGRGHRRGVGSSHQVVIESMFGYDFGTPVGHTREYLSILRPLLAGQPAKLRGEQVSANVTLTTPGPTPVPLLLAALGPRMLRLAPALAGGPGPGMTGAAPGGGAH